MENKEIAEALIAEYRKKEMAMAGEVGPYMNTPEEDWCKNRKKAGELGERYLLDASELMEKLRRNMGADSQAIRDAIPEPARGPIIELIEARYSETMDNLRSAMDSMEIDVWWTLPYDSGRKPPASVQKLQQYIRGS